MASTSSWTGIGREILDRYLQSEKGEGGGDAGQMGIDIFNEGFESEFPGDADDPIAGTYQGYSPEANRASDSRPWGNSFSDRPKIHELNQPPAAQALGWRVIDFYPNRDNKSEFYRLAGTPAELRQMLQIIQATRFVTGTRINFEVWFEMWEQGFSAFTNDRADSNFALNGDKQWGRIKDPKTRPRYRECSNSQQRADYGFRVIEYWRDRSDEENSIFLAGTDSMLIDQILAYEYQGNGASAQDSVGSDVIRHSGIPEVTLFFKGIDKSLPAKDQTVTGQISFRLTGHTDNPATATVRPDLKLITQSDINSLGTKIKSIFRTLPPYIWSKGKRQLIYHDWVRGYNLNIYCSNYAEGERLLLAVVGLRNFQIDERFVKYGEAKNPVAAYPPATEFQFLGEKHKTPERLPTADVTFQYAKIYLPTIKKKKIIA